MQFKVLDTFRVGHITISAIEIKFNTFEYMKTRDTFRISAKFKKIFIGTVVNGVLV